MGDGEKKSEVQIYGNGKKKESEKIWEVQIYGNKKYIGREK